MIAETYDHTEVLKALAQSAYEIQRHLGQLLKLTAIPRLRFRVDTLLEEAARIDKLFRDPHVLQDLREEDKEEDSSPLPSPEAEGAQEED
jgi:ribosome-binding factor A